MKSITLFIFLVLLQANLGDAYAKKDIKKLCGKAIRRLAPDGKPDKKAGKRSGMKIHGDKPRQDF